MRKGGRSTEEASEAHRPEERGDGFDMLPAPPAIGHPARDGNNAGGNV